MCHGSEVVAARARKSRGLSGWQIEVGRSRYVPRACDHQHAQRSESLFPIPSSSPSSGFHLFAPSNNRSFDSFGSAPSLAASDASLCCCFSRSTSIRGPLFTRGGHCKSARPPCRKVEGQFLGVRKRRTRTQLPRIATRWAFLARTNLIPSTTATTTNDSQLNFPATTGRSGRHDSF
jgi:hypothetical protein